MVTSSAMSAPRTALVPDDFTVPTGLTGESFRLRMLCIQDLARDYDAVMSSRDHLKSLAPGSSWPDGLTLEQNLIDLGWHQKEFQRRSSFAYTVVDPADERTLGCVYIYPATSSEFDAEVYLWARQSELASGLEQTLLAEIRRWLVGEWPFGRVAFPGRDA